ncbi:MAG: flagellin lysine-N-methylase [Lachnospiraceae bacterium]|nr:flagellin lysine-N-methylase [Lachnospiraceae bacterium]
MYYRKPYNYSEFNCIADKCPATCCDGWAIVIDDRTMERYRGLADEDREYVLSHVDTQEGVFKQCGSRCSFLNDRKLCDLYTRLGEEGFCNTCRRYPRHFEEYGNLIEAALSMSCPVAAKMIITNPNPDRYVEYSNDKVSPHHAEVDSVLLAGLLESRKHIIDIMNDRSMPLQYRIRRAYQYSAKVQKLIYNYERLGSRVKRPKSVSEFLLKMDMLTKKELLYSEDMKCQSIRKDIYEESHISIHRQSNMKAAVDTLLVLENINADWPELVKELTAILYEDMSVERYMSLSREFADYMKDRLYEYEHIFNYFIYTYYLGGVYDYNVHAMTKMALVSMAVIRDLGMLVWIKAGKEFSEEDQIRLCHTYSRQIEHSDENLMSLEGLLNAHPRFDDKNMVRII